MVRTLYRLLLTLTPTTRLGDKIVSFLFFIAYMRRWPKKGFLFNDYLFQIKTSNEILDPLRIFVSDKEYVKLYVKATVGKNIRCQPWTF